MEWLFPVYIAATIFGVGVTVVDLLGLIGGEAAGESGGDGDDGGDDGADGDVDTDVSGEMPAIDDAGVDGGEGDAADSDDAAGDEVPAEAESGEDGRASIVGHDKRQRGSLVLRALSGVRSVVYFSLGFGPVGWFAFARGEGIGASLLWSVPVGVAVMLGVRIVRRLMRQELDSQLKDSDLIMEKAVVCVTINKGRMGKVRVEAGGTYAERYARAKDPGLTIVKDTRVRVVDVADDCLYVEKES